VVLAFPVAEVAVTNFIIVSPFGICGDWIASAGVPNNVGHYVPASGKDCLSTPRFDPMAAGVCSASV